MFKTCNTLRSCHNFPAGSRQAARGARICETSLLVWLSAVDGMDIGSDIRSAVRFLETSSVILNDVIRRTKVNWKHSSPRNWEKNMFDVVASTVPPDGLSQLGAWTSAGIAMPKYESQYLKG